MHTDDFDFQLPSDLIAQAPLAERDASRLMHLSPDGQLAHRAFRELPALLRRGDVVVFNDSRVIPARLLGTKMASGGKVEVLLVRPEAQMSTAFALSEAGAGTEWRCMGQSSKGFRKGMALAFDGGLSAEIVEVLGEGHLTVRFTSSLGSLEQALAQAGQLPLPPYIARSPEAADETRYQTVYAQTAGSVAAPTAGLHFTPTVIEALDAKGVQRAMVSLDVGPGTFLPVREGDITNHRMHAERFTVPESTAAMVNAALSEGRRVVAVGTTVVRTLESAWAEGRVRAGRRETDIFITPGYAFQVTAALVTNFHLPKSTLLMLVSALAGRQSVLSAYSAAVNERYRFFSYGDAMFIETR
jgi:S-adenosylmethionine:tRNA ribosyltransferase-isomerase